MSIDPHKQVLEEFFNKARPLTLNDLHSQLKHLEKKQLDTILEILLKKEKLIMKMNGKMKIYCYNFNQTEDKELSQSFDEINKHYMKYLKKVNEKEDEIKRLKNLLNEKNNDQNDELEENITLEELEHEHELLKSRIDAYQQQINEKDVNEEKNNVDEKIIKEAIKVYTTYRDAYIKRKRIAYDMLKGISNVSNKSVKKLIEDTEVETDNLVQFNFQNYPELLE
ncbi:hypothetical protein PVAND_002567 [Polypedilum vanderplanki]|uniref:Homologous-pairing protein 2 winged helix domain-containing protein n=1 Tax=Polypedilum vanderplanki TaxID=319348 RepID=A0A9J6BRK4_POLVA|nr:hypothetical protein PVAND_002567 [Polypedilum vanderplanki]